MKRLIRHLIPYSLLSFVILCTIRLIVIFPPLIMQRVIDIHIPNGDIAKAVRSVLLFTGIPVAAGAAQAGSSGCGLPTYRKQSPLSARPSSPLPPSRA